MSWYIETAVRIHIDDDPELLGKFVRWINERNDIQLIFDAVINGRNATFVTHRVHLAAVRNALIDLSAEGA